MNKVPTVVVSVETKLGARYVFPDVLRDSLIHLPESGRVPSNQPTVCFVNLSQAVLTIPLSIVRRIWAEKDENLWVSDA